MGKFEKINNHEINTDLNGGGFINKLLTGNLFEEDYLGDLNTQPQWDNWFKKLFKRHQKLHVFSKKDPEYIQGKGNGEYEIFILPDLIENYDFSTIVNIYKDYYNFENNVWKIYKDDNIGKTFKRDKIKTPRKNYLIPGIVKKSITKLIAYLEKNVKEGNGDPDQLNFGIKSLKLSLQEQPFTTLKNKFGLGLTQEEKMKKDDEKIKSNEQKQKQKEEEKKRKEMMKVESKKIKKTNSEILVEVKNIRKEIENLSKQLQKVSSEANIPKEVKRRDLKLENKMKADRIREEINNLVKQEEAIIKDLFDTHLSRSKVLFKNYI
jgi:hypothetical protein